jgi:hypothetical protein
MYRELGVEKAADFVLEGPSFTNGTVSDSFDGIDYPSFVYDAGMQILANAFDWILQQSAAIEPEVLIPNVDISVNYYLKAQVLIFALIGLFVSTLLSYLS